MAWLLFFVLLAKVAMVEASEMCNMYEMVNESVNLYYHGPPKPLAPEGVPIFAELCSSLLPPDYAPGNTLKTCCSVNQLTFFRTMVASAEKMVPFCKPCLENIYRLTCSLICSPNQADFTDMITSPLDPSLVVAVLYAVSEEFATAFFNSCKSVKSPNSLLLFANFLCPEGVDKCTPGTFVSSILAGGTFNVSLRLFPSTTKLPSPMLIPMNDTALSCNQSYQFHKGNVSSCGCIDCETSCSPVFPDGDSASFWSSPFLFHRFTVYQLVVSSVYLLLLVALVITVSALHLRQRLRAKDSQGERDALMNPFMGSESENPDFNPAGAANLSSDLYAKRQLAHTLRSRIHVKLCLGLSKWGVLVARYRLTFLVLPLMAVSILASGIVFYFSVTSDPIELWSAPGSELRRQKDFFDQHFGPFYRTEQIILRAPTLNSTVIQARDRDIHIGPALHPEVVKEMFFLHERIASIKAGYLVHENNQTSIKTLVLDDICLKPMYPNNSNCAFYSVTQYFQNNLSLVTGESGANYAWLQHLAQCAHNPLIIADTDFDMISCLSSFMAPVPANLVFAGYDTDPLSATALVLTYVVQNYPKEDPRSQLALSWEKELIHLLKSYSHPVVQIDFSSERSVEDEINRQSTAQANTVLISYAVMFAYVAIALGRIPSKHLLNLFIEQKFMLGLVGVVLVLVSVLASVGLFCFLKFKVTMIVLEVLPFLTLAIGVDNIFLLVHAYQRSNCNSDLSLSIPDVVGQVMGEVGHGMVVSAVVQIGVFSIGSISSIPAVRSFSLFAAVALAVNFFLQMTVFLSLFALDASRERARRPNIFCCFPLSASPEEAGGPGPLQAIFAPFSWLVLHRFSRPFIIFFFSIGWFLCLFHIPSLPIGLDQISALPLDSYLHPYFHSVFNLLRAGPPVYFVVSPGYQYELPEKQSLICSFGPCSQDSLTSLVYSHARQSNLSRLASPADSWVDTYLAWLQPSDSGPSCCSYQNTSATSGGGKKFCPTSTVRDFSECYPCLQRNSSEIVHPSAQQFGEYLAWFLADIPNPSCPLGGKPSYGSNVILNPHPQNCSTDPDPNCPLAVATSRFMAYHTSLSTSEDFIHALRRSTALSRDLSASLKHNVTSYSVFYIYYEYCFTIWKDTLISLGASFGAVLLANLILFGFDLRMTALMTFLLMAMTISDAGAMYILGLSLNPVSLVNLVMFTGVNVEFVSHIARGFLSSTAKTRVAKARSALILTGSSVFSGIVMTKILGVSVLAFSGSMLFRLYYFQMYAAAIGIGALHGLVLLPVMLSLFGPLDSPCANHIGEVLESNEDVEGEEALFS